MTGTTAPSPRTDLPALTTADIDAIAAAFETFFGGSATALDDKVAVLEDGESYRQMLVDASANQQFQQMSTDIRSIRLGSSSECRTLAGRPECAVVTHDVLIGGVPMAAGIESPAVRSGSTWVVSARAWCGLVEIGGETCPTVPEQSP